MRALVEELKRRAAKLTKDMGKELEKNIPVSENLDVGSKAFFGEILGPLKEARDKLDSRIDGLRNQIIYLEALLESAENLLSSSEDVIEEIESCKEMENVSG